MLEANVEVSALKHSGRGGLQGRSPLLRLQSVERLVALTRRGNAAAFELLVGRYQPRLLAFCRHLLSSREDAEDVLQEVFAASYSAMLA
ncbi:MAG: RNA polymerase sigma factor, partial [Solirubrobacteraceae bacterium]